MMAERGRARQPVSRPGPGGPGRTGADAPQPRATSAPASRWAKMERTHLQDAVPIRLGQEFGAYRRAIARDIARIRGVGQHLARTMSSTTRRIRAASDRATAR
jgi:hypothetical protein